VLSSLVEYCALLPQELSSSCRQSGHSTFIACKRWLVPRACPNELALGTSSDWHSLCRQDLDRHIGITRMTSQEDFDLHHRLLHEQRMAEARSLHCACMRMFAFLLQTLRLPRQLASHPWLQQCSGRVIAARPRMMQVLPGA
jgi:hypothetical protein